jgi:hypothetical protein
MTTIITEEAVTAANEDTIDGNIIAEAGRLEQECLAASILKDYKRRSAWCSGHGPELPALMYEAACDPRLSSEDFYNLAGDNWTRQETVDYERWQEIFTELRPAGHEDMMSDSELVEYYNIKQIKDPVIIYRTAHKDHLEKGWSWTNDLTAALKFMDYSVSSIRTYKTGT